MAKEKKAKLTPGLKSEHKVGVLLEEIRSEVKTVSEQHGSIMQKLEEHDKSFKKIDTKLEQHDLQFLKIESHLEKIELKLIGYDKKFDQIEKVISTVMSDHETRIKNVEEKVTSI